MLINRENWVVHRPWAILSAALIVACFGWFVFAGVGQPAWPGGASLPGFTFGIVGGGIIIFECLLWWRKRVRTWRIGRTKVWLRAHIWLGLVSLPLLVLHSGLRLGGTLSTVLLLLLIAVVLSGIVGLVLQHMLPKQMLDEIPSETIFGQIEHVTNLMLIESRRLVLATCGLEDGEQEAEEIEQGEDPSYRTLGKVRSAGRVRGRVLETVASAAPVAETQPLREFFHDKVEPFLTERRVKNLPLYAQSQSAVLFRELRARLKPSAHAAVDALEDVCQQRREFERQRQLHVWLHGWLLVHLPLSIALLVLMFLHVFVALKYW